MELEEFKSTVIPLRKKLEHVARNILRYDIDVEDAVQETYLRLWSVREKLSDHPNVSAYTMQTLKNVCIDRIRTTRYNTAIDTMSLTEPNPNPYILAEEKDSVSIIQKIIDSLPETQRRIIQMRDIEDYDLKEIADIIGSEESTVRVNLSRARKKVRDTYLLINNAML